MSTATHFPTHAVWHPWCSAMVDKGWMAITSPGCPWQAHLGVPPSPNSPQVLRASEGKFPLRRLELKSCGLFGSLQDSSPTILEHQGQPDIRWRHARNLSSLALSDGQLASLWVQQASTGNMWKHYSTLTSYPQDILHREQSAQSQAPHLARAATPPEAPISTIWSAFSLSI